MNNTTILQCIELSKSYRERIIFNDVLHKISFSIHTGDMIAILGSSGSGKSTLLHLLGGLDNPTSGKVIFEGQSLYDISSSSRAEIRNRKLGFIYQFHHLLLDFSALENTAMPLLIGGIKAKIAENIAYKMLSVVGMQRRSQHFPSELSGGERQRVAIARALINNPILVLADEPTGNLDKKNSDNILELLKELNACYNTAFLVVTHDLELANKLSLQLKIQDGKIQSCANMSGSHQ